MWDGAVNKELTSLLESAVKRDAIVATCGHGAVALLEVKTKHNATVDYYVKNKEAKSFSIITQLVSALSVVAERRPPAALLLGLGLMQKAVL